MPAQLSPPVSELASLFDSFSSRWLGETSGLPEGMEVRWQTKSIVLLLVLQGAVNAQVADNRLDCLRARQISWLAVCPEDALHVDCVSGTRAMLLRFPAEWARSTLGLLHQEMAADFCQLIAATGDQREVRRTLEPEDMAWCRAFMAPTLCTAARKLLEGSRMSEFFFRKLLAERRPLEHFCTRTRRIAQERVEKVRLALAHDLENPPSLESLARLCGCNPQYLSRTFSEVAGMTISQYLRRLRIERAAQLLASGRMNASEAALEVGYQSLSHFSQAFREEKGLTPSRWMRSGPAPMRKIA